MPANCYKNEAETLKNMHKSIYLEAILKPKIYSTFEHFRCCTGRE